MCVTMLPKHFICSHNVHLCELKKKIVFSIIIGLFYRFRVIRYGDTCAWSLLSVGLHIEFWMYVSRMVGTRWPSHYHYAWVLNLMLKSWSLRCQVTSFHCNAGITPCILSLFFRFCYLSRQMWGLYLKIVLGHILSYLTAHHSELSGGVLVLCSPNSWCIVI